MGLELGSGRQALQSEGLKAEKTSSPKDFGGIGHWSVSASGWGLVVKGLGRKALSFGELWLDVPLNGTRHYWRSVGLRYCVCRISSQTLSVTDMGHKLCMFSTKVLVLHFMTTMSTTRSTSRRCVVLSRAGCRWWSSRGARCHEATKPCQIRPTSHR